MLTASAVHTAIVARIKHAHSNAVTWKPNPIPTTTTVAAAWIHAFGCVRNTSHTPENACLKLWSRPVSRIQTSVTLSPSHPEPRLVTRESIAPRTLSIGALTSRERSEQIVERAFGTDRGNDGIDLFPR